MSNYIQHKDKIAFHPGYYIKELIDESGLTQRDFAVRLGTTPKTISALINGKQSLSVSIAAKLSRMYGSTIAYWINLQNTYDELLEAFALDEELQRERDTFSYVDYSYFTRFLGLPSLARDIDAQIQCVREYLTVGSLTVFNNPDFAVSYRSGSDHLTDSNIINSNIMLQIAIKKAIDADAPAFNKRKFQKAVRHILTLTSDHETFVTSIKESFWECGVILVALPSLKNSGIAGATKKIGDKVLLMVTDRRHYEDAFWFTLFHEIGHIMNADYGVTRSDIDLEREAIADSFAQDSLIPKADYEAYISNTSHFSESDIREFAASIHRDPGIVLGRLQNDKIVSFAATSLNRNLKHSFRLDKII